MSEWQTISDGITHVISIIDDRIRTYENKLRFENGSDEVKAEQRFAVEVLEIVKANILHDFKTPSLERQDTVSEQWKIRWSHQGTFDFEGTEEDAEKWRVDWCRQYREIGFKWRSDPENQTVIDKLQELKAWFWDRQYGCPAFVFTQIKKAKQGKLTCPTLKEPPTPTAPNATDGE